MKNNLKLIQPLQYNHLFSEYHNKTTKLTNLKIKLPQITNLFSSQKKIEHKQNDQDTSSFFKKNYEKLKRIQHTSRIKKFHNKLMYPFLNISVDNEKKNKTNNDILPSTSIIYRSHKEINGKIIDKSFRDKSTDTNRVNMIYLNLFKSPIQGIKQNIFNLDSFYNGIDDIDFKKNNENENEKENEIIKQKMNEINNKSILKIQNIFKETDFGKLHDELLNLNNI